MAEAKNTITLEEYIGKLNGKGSFIIPDYQRGYIWGQYNPYYKKADAPDSVSYLINSILNGFRQEPKKDMQEPKKDIFLQGITAHSNNDTNDITLVDGQQRTTFFYLLLKYLGYKGYISMEYAIRKESDGFLKRIDDFLKEINISDFKEDENEQFQDLYFFKKTIRIFNDKLKNINKKDLREYILEHVRFLYISIPEDKANIVFSMMNGNKAIMLQEELIKSELLRCSSKNTDDIEEAENISIRSRFAREWDKWLHWWNDEDVKKFFKCDRQLGWLLPLIIEDTEDVSFEQFKEKCLKIGNVKEAKEIFRKMRLLQKSIEDAYSNPITYNYIGAILCIRDKKDRYEFLKWYFDLVGEEQHEQVQVKLKHYFDWAFIKLTHKEIVDNNKEKYKEKREAFYNVLNKDDIYKGRIDADYNDAANWLLRCNILEDCSQNQHKGRKFNFDIWNYRSLEHIYPKSKVGHKDEKGTELDYKNDQLTDDQKITLWREEILYNEGGTQYCASEHSIGNLVLLYKRENSIFNDDDFSDKKNIFFTINNDAGFQSRHLLHTVSVFAHSTWEGEDIAKHKRQEIERFTNEYPEL